jgi:hypothetical protein
MPDWKVLVRERCEGLEESVITELAGHLEDSIEEFRAQGLCKSEAIQRSLEQVNDWPGLSGKIHRAKYQEGMMNTRTKTLWLPALVSLTTAMVFLMISTNLALQPGFLTGHFLNLHTSTTSTDYPLVAYLPWVIALPFCGAAGAYLSRRGGGQRRARLVAGLFPAIALFSLVGFLTLFGQIVPFQHQWSRFATALLLLTVPQGVARFLGVLPFLKDIKSQMLA